MLTDKQIQTLARKFEKEYDQSDGEQHPWEMIARFLSDSGVLDEIEEDHHGFNIHSVEAQQDARSKLLT